MKTGLYSVLNAVISSLAIVICFVPFVFLGFRKVRRVNTYCAIGIYWFFNGIVNLPALRLIRSEGIRNFLARLSDYYDLVDAPLMLLVFALSTSGKPRKRLLLVLLGLIAGESTLVARKGYTASWRMNIGAGAGIVLLFSVTGLWQYLKKMEHNRFENSMAYFYASSLFGYGTYLIIYLMTIFKTSSIAYNEADSFLLYYISLLLSAVVTSTGIWSYGLRKQHAGSMAPGYSSSSS